MDSSHLYQQIVESIRKDILSGALKPGARLPAIRKLTEQWQCNTGTILRAYQELSRLGLVVSHVGQVPSGGTLAGTKPDTLAPGGLINRTEAFLLDMMMAGFTPDEIEQSMRVALDRWRAFSSEPDEVPPGCCVLWAATTLPWL